MRGILVALLRGVLIGLALCAIFFAGFLVRGVIPPALNVAVLKLQGVTNTPGSYPLLTEVQSYLNNYYLRPQPDQKTLEYSAIRGMLGSLNDPYTIFIDPPVAHSESDVLTGKYGGIGVLIKRDAQANYVLYPFPDGPAAKAGVVNGDVLLKVNDKALDPSIQADALDQMLRGEVKDDNGVSIDIKRGSNEQSFKIAFQEIDVPSVVWYTLSDAPTFGYVQIMRFTNRTPDELTTALTDLRSKHITALILDLRGNPGGLLNESIQVVGQFLDGGVVIYEHDRNTETELDAPKGGLMLDLPMAVLVNKDTASAAEIVAGALHDRQRAILIGQPTHGKGSVQSIYQLSDQSSLHVTIAEWFSPNKIPIDGKGITPDMLVTPDPSGLDAELTQAERYLQSKTPVPLVLLR